MYPANPYGGEDVVSVTTVAARTRNTGELNAKIKAAGGVLVTDINSSDYIVAVNNGLRFTVTALPDGRYQITESSNWLLLLGAVLIGGLVLFRR